jgi:superoxide reductase
MLPLKELLQGADWKTEKHVPVIEAPDKVKKLDIVTINLSVGKEIAHPNTTEHHIVWVEVYFLPKGEKFPYQIGRFEFSCHGASIQGSNTSSIYTQPSVTINLKTEKSGTIIATSYCNIHGLWENSKDIIVE